MNDAVKCKPAFSSGLIHTPPRTTTSYIYNTHLDLSEKRDQIYGVEACGNTAHCRLRHHLVEQQAYYHGSSKESIPRYL